MLEIVNGTPSTFTRASSPLFIKASRGRAWEPYGHLGNHQGADLRGTWHRVLGTPIEGRKRTQAEEPNGSNTRSSLNNLFFELFRPFPFGEGLCFPPKRLRETHKSPCAAAPAAGLSACCLYCSCAGANGGRAFLPCAQTGSSIFRPSSDYDLS